MIRVLLFFSRLSPVDGGKGIQPTIYELDQSLMTCSCPGNVRPVFPGGRGPGRERRRPGGMARRGASLKESATTGERTAALRIPGAALGSGLVLDRRVLGCKGLGALLLILWYGVPRLAWPDEYMGAFPTGGPLGGFSRSFSRSALKRKAFPLGARPGGGLGDAAPGFGG